jgi:hypothetical protein
MNKQLTPEEIKQIKKLKDKEATQQIIIKEHEQPHRATDKK